jgi:hypothetical protein
MSEHEKIIRGGAWSHDASCFRAADHYNNIINSSNTSCAYGFRLVMFEPLEKEISVEDMQKIVDVNEKLVKELEDVKD